MADATRLWVSYKGESTVIQRYRVNGQVCDPGLPRAQRAPAPGEGEASVHAPASTGHSTTSSLSFLACKTERARLITDSYVKCEDAQICACHTGGKCQRAQQRLFLLFRRRGLETPKLLVVFIISGSHLGSGPARMPGAFQGLAQTTTSRAQTRFSSPRPGSPPTPTRTPATVQDAGLLPFVLRARRGLWDGGCHVWGSWPARRGSRGSTPRGWPAAAGNGSKGEQGLRRGQSARCGRGGGGGEAEHTLPHMPLHWAGRTRGFGGRSAGTHSPPHGSPGRQGPTAPTATPGSLRPDRACPAAPPARGPGSPSSPLLAAAEPGRRGLGRTDTCGRPGLPGGLLVAGQLSGRDGGRQGEEEECGRSRKGRGRSAQAPAGSGLDEEVQTR